MNLVLSLVIHGLFVAVAAFWAAHEGMLGERLKELSVLLVPKEKKPEPEKTAESKPEAKPADGSAKAATETKAAPIVRAIPPPQAPPPAADLVAAPPPAVLPSFTFSEAAASPGTGGDRVEAYRAYLQSVLQQQWDRPEDAADESYVAEVEVRLDAAGTLLGFEWRKGSGDTRWDESVRKALDRKKSIGRPLPKDFPDKVIVRFDVQPAKDTFLQ